MLRYLGVLIYEMKEVNNYNAGFENGLQVEFCKAQERCNISVHPEMPHGKLANLKDNWTQPMSIVNSMALSTLQ